MFNMPFDPYEYDSWYDRHSSIFKAELEAIKNVSRNCPEQTLEVGAGTGRFAEKLDVDWCLDPDEKMLELASGRCEHTVKGYAEDLPFETGSLGTVFFITSLSFIKKPSLAILEAHRVLRNDGCLIIGFIPKQSYFGRKYEKYRKEGDMRFSKAHFFTYEEVLSLLEPYFTTYTVYSTLLGDKLLENVVHGYHKDASFVAIRFVKKVFIGNAHGTVKGD